MTTCKRINEKYGHAKGQSETPKVRLEQKKPTAAANNTASKMNMTTTKRSKEKMLVIKLAHALPNRNFDLKHTKLLK